MSYLARLKQRVGENVPDNGATKVTQGSSVPFVATHPAPFATNEIPAEVRRLAEAVAVLRGWSPGEVADTLADWQADPDGTEAALRHLLALGAADPGPAPTDDRRRCDQCGNLRGRVCSVASVGGVVSARVGYEPVRDLLRRCEGYLPKAGEADQRPGAERWPGLGRTAP